jgi:capsular polysaccharide biosynthesis protein
MKTGRPFSERLYAEFVRLYPGRFRNDFAEEMERLFREQYQDARNAGGFSVTSFWFRTLRDLGLSLIREHIEELKANMNTHFLLQFCSKNLTFTRLTLGLTVCLVGLCALITLMVLPRVYLSKSLIGMPAEKYDAYQVHTFLEQIQSRKVLDPVIARLNLTSALAKESGLKSELTPDEAYQNLSRMITLRQHRNTPLVEIGVYSQNRDLCAKIANEITEVAMQISAFNRRGQTVGDARGNSEADNAIAGISWLEKAAPESRPVRPNVPLNIVVGGILSVVIASVAAAFMRLFLKAASPAC